MTYEITQELAQALLNYLAERPVKEVLNLFQALQQIKPLPETDGKEQPTSESTPAQ